MNDYRVHFYPLDNLLKSRSQTNLFFEQINLSDDNGIILPKVNYFSTYSLNQDKTRERKYNFIKDKKIKKENYKRKLLIGYFQSFLSLLRSSPIQKYNLQLIVS